MSNCARLPTSRCTTTDFRLHRTRGMILKLQFSFRDCEGIAAPCSFPSRHRSKAKRWMCREVPQKSKFRVCGLDASALEASLITGWKWGRPAKKQFLFLRMTKSRTPFEATDWRAKYTSQTVWALREETRKRSFTRT